ncbi:acetyl-CoA synthetase-like protein [Cylindrobasidium torrendii FP15055 ss-10]|uniref:Acetyl-CoA synthetase-like protein n=1 Tax=Cylindrobasidium torrendii FP15055 ss-10 TaxID=1314674 RepID=A0A0D7BB11_9AGAR|nr:acetyl-CoA synthetase-like protein [Cylindrobasidium torrendii FP15055 ss-10]
MGLDIAQHIVTDDLTVLLGLIAATVFLLHNFYKPQPLVHPILLGRQSDVARVRNPGQSAVYRNYATGLMGRLPLRPTKDVYILGDLIRPELDAPRTLWNTRITNSALQDRVASFGTGLLRLAKLESGDSNVLLLVNDCIEFLISDLALASHSIPSFTISSSDVLSSVLDSHPPSAIIADAHFLPTLLELIYDAGEVGQHHTIIVVGEPTRQAMASVASSVKVYSWDDVEREGTKTQKILSPIPKPSDIFSVSFWSSGDGQLQGAQLTHENITAGVTAIRALMPASHALSPLDTVVSAHSLSTAYGRAIAYTALFEGTSFATLQSTQILRTSEIDPKYNVKDVTSARTYKIPSPTVLFVKPDHVEALVSSILKTAQKNRILYPFAWRHKVAGIQEGFLSKDSLWDRLVFDAARAKVVGEAAGTLAAVISSGGTIPASLLTPARVAFSAGFVNAYTHPVVAGPILASHPLDLQTFPGPDTAPAHVGPPAINIEARLLNVSDAAIKADGDPEGTFVVRGPSVGKLLGEDYVNVASETIPGSSEEEEGWVATGRTARIKPNGAFIVL